MDSSPNRVSTLWGSYTVGVRSGAKTLAGVRHSKDCVLRGRRRESAPWMRSKGSIPEKGCIFGTWTWGSVCVASAAFRMTLGHDFVAGAVLLKHVSIFVEVSQKTLILEVRIFSLTSSQKRTKSRIKRSFWSSGSSVFEQVSHKTLLLEVRIFSFQGSLA